MTIDHSEEPRARAAKQILLVDDDDALRRLLCVMLEQMNFHSTCARSGIEALEILDREGIARFDSVVTDIRMPKMTGLELAREIRSRHASMPILFISGYTPSAESLEAQLDEHSAFLRKPFTYDSLSNSLKDLLRQSSRESSRCFSSRNGRISRRTAV